MAMRGTEWCVDETGGRKEGRIGRKEERKGGGKVGRRKGKRTHNAVVSSISSSDDDNVLALGRDVAGRVRQVIIEKSLGVLSEELHRKVDPVNFAVLHLEVSRPSRSGRHDEGVVLSANLLDVVRDTDVSAGDELDTFRRHEIEATLDDALVELHAASRGRQ
jgi:hypothetical protein